MPDDKLDPNAPAPENGDQPAVTVDLEAPKESPKPQTNEAILAKLNELAEINQRLDNRLKASARVTDRLQRELDQIRSGTPVPKAEPKPIQVPEDETQRITELKPWEKSLRQISREEAERVHQEKEQVRQTQEIERSRLDELERSKNFVSEKYPNLDKDEQLTETYLSVVNAHPEWHKDPFGPVRAMLEMERLAKEQGVALPVTSATLKPNTETVRRARAASSSLPPGRPLPSTTKITLTKDQESFAKANKIPIESYARMVNGLNTNGGIEA